MAFLGGSAFAMARDIAEGYHLVTERTLRSMQAAEIEQLSFEIDRLLRDVRGSSTPRDDLPALKARNRKIQRLNTVTMVLRTYRQKKRSPTPSR